MYSSTDYGTSWSIANIGLTNHEVYSLAIHRDESGIANIIAGAFNGVFRSTNNGASWTLVNSTMGSIVTFASSGMNLFAGVGFNGVFLSTNSGQAGPRLIQDFRRSRLLSLLLLAARISLQG